MKKTVIILLAAALCGAGLTAGENTEGKGYTSEQEYLFGIFQNRRSVRKFKDTPVPMEQVRKILDMARTAPTSGNQQPWKFLVITRGEKIEELKNELLRSYMERLKENGITDRNVLDQRRERMTAYYGDYLSAPVNIVVLTDSASRYPAYNRYDGPLAAGYLMLAARALGYGTVFATDSIPPDITRKILEIPEQFEIVCFTPLGVPEEWPESKPKKLLDEFIVLDRFEEGKNYVKKTVRKAVTLDEQVLARYTGEYRVSDQLLIRISLKEGGLFLQVTGQPEFPLYAESETVFFLKVTDATVTFRLSDRGKTEGLVFRQPGREIKADKVQ